MTAVLRSYDETGTLWDGHCDRLLNESGRGNASGWNVLRERGVRILGLHADFHGHGVLEGTK